MAYYTPAVSTVQVGVFLQNGFTVDDVAHLGTNIATALEFCEKHGIVHKDIKPDNLFYSPEENQYKLGDFGIAHYLTSPSGGKGRAGTFTHMPPEVYHGSPFTPSSDLYALGMVLYRLLNDNRIPFLPPFPKPFTPAQREQALMRRLDGEQIETPSIIRYSLSLLESFKQALGPDLAKKIAGWLSHWGKLRKEQSQLIQRIASRQQRNYESVFRMPWIKESKRL